MDIARSKVFFMCGPAGSGKSTVAKKFEVAGMVKLSFDEVSFKRGISTHPLSESVREEIKKELDLKLVELIEHNVDVVLDYSFWSRKMRREYIDLLEKYKIIPLILYVKCPKALAIERLMNRSGSHESDIQLSPETAHQYYGNFEVPTDDEGEIIVVEGF